MLLEQLPNISISSLDIQNSKNPSAILDCGKDSAMVIRTFNQHMWQGRKLVVQRERRKKTSNNEKSNSNFGGWSRPAASEFTPISVQQASDNIQEVVEDAMGIAEADPDVDPLDTAIASTAAASLLAAMQAIDGGGTSIDTMYGDQDEYDETNEPATFEMKPMADLLAEFGQQDPNWKKQVVTEGTSSSEKGESRLGMRGKAPIHVCFHSFGFSKGAPPRMDGWAHSQPLLPFDCREYPTVPGYLAWQDGLSAAVKRAMEASGPESLRDFAKSMSDEVWKALQEAQAAGYGYASPLEMVIYVGSESGRHRSVVASEWAATQLRKLLRANLNEALDQPVSVGTIHRDVDASRQKKSLGDVSSKKARERGFAGDW
eukprot:Nitzschia sp. Nitz4//scaffold337_size18511//14150//15268//NITZ4_008783-RA/size18511-processed-gene-0.14-mRNA-1//-1//CDS//3329548319//8974//frame0